VLAPPTPPACSPTQNLVNFVQFNGDINGIINANCRFTPPSAFPYCAFSGWACLPFTHSGGSDWEFTPINVFGVRVVGNLTNSYVEVLVYRNNANFGHVNFDGIYPLAPFEQWHVLVSVNCLTQVIQVYVNDKSLSPNNSPSWLALEDMAQQTTNGSGNLTGVYVGALGGLYPAAADFWWYPSMTDWLDLSVVANRRKFINADLTPVYLGANGELPMGAPAPIFLTARTSASDLITNYGQGGVPFPGYSASFEINLGQPDPSLPPLAMQDPGVCPCATKGCANYQVVVWSRGGASSGNTVPANFVVSNDSGLTWTKTARTDMLSGDAWGSSYVPVNDGVYNEYLLLDTFVNPSYPGFALVATSGCGTSVWNSSGVCKTTIAGFPTAAVVPWWNNTPISAHPVGTCPWQSYTGALSGSDEVAAGLNEAGFGSVNLHYNTGVSTDGGSTWTMGGTDSARTPPQTNGLFYVDQFFSGGNTGSTIFAQSAGGAIMYLVSGTFVYKSVDHGLTWTSVASADLPQVLWTPTGQHIVQCVGHIKCDTTGSKIVFAGQMYNSDGSTFVAPSVWTTVNGGTSWINAANPTVLGIAAANGPQGIWLGSSPNGNVLLLTSPIGATATFGVWASLNGGSTWVNVASTPAKGSQAIGCAVSPDGECFAVLLGEHGPSSTSGSPTTWMEVSTDQGNTWCSMEVPFDYVTATPDLYVFPAGS